MFQFLPDEIIEAGNITTECHINQVPEFVGAQIDRLYGHLLCSFCNFHSENELREASTYVARTDGVPTAVFLFRIQPHEVIVISEFIRLSADDINRFADTIFARFPAVRMISFNKVEAPTETAVAPYPQQVLNRTEDIVVELPPTVAQYQANLGKNMRRNIKRYTNTLEQDFPSYRYRVYIEQEVSEQHIRDIVQLNRVRMAGKNIVSRIDEEETQWVVGLAKQRGIVGVATIDGKVCGGAIGFRIGDDYFMHIIAHDPAYNDYSLGILCYYFTICEGIVRGGKRFHLLPGRYEYKYRLLGQTRDIVRIDVYRSRAQMLRYGRRVLATAVEVHVRQAKLWLLESERRDDSWSRLASRLLRFLRHAKRARAGVTPVGGHSG